MADRYSFDENGVRRIVASVRRVEASPHSGPLFLTPMVSSGTPEKWIGCKNNAAETIPAWSCAAIGTGSTIDGVYHPHASKPSTTFTRSYALTGGRDATTVDKVGVTFEAGLCKYDTGTPAVGETWGPKPGQWTLSRYYSGFRCVGILDSTNKIALWEREEPPFYLCKADSSISKGSTGTASLYVGDSGSETDSTVNITSCKALWGAIATSKWCGVSFVNGVPYITQLEC